MHQAAETSQKRKPRKETENSLSPLKRFRPVSSPIFFPSSPLSFRPPRPRRPGRPPPPPSRPSPCEPRALPPAPSTCHTGREAEAPRVPRSRGGQSCRRRARGRPSRAPTPTPASPRRSGDGDDHQGLGGASEAVCHEHRQLGIAVGDVEEDEEGFDVGLEVEVRAEMTSPSAESDPLIAAASLRACPSEPDFLSRSLPARSTNASFPFERCPVWRLRLETWMVTTRCDLEEAAFIFFRFVFRFFFGGGVFFFVRSFPGHVSPLFSPPPALQSRFSSHLREGRERREAERTSVGDTRAAAPRPRSSSRAAPPRRTPSPSRPLGRRRCPSSGLA